MTRITRWPATALLSLAAFSGGSALAQTEVPLPAADPAGDPASPSEAGPAPVSPPPVSPQPTTAAAEAMPEAGAANTPTPDVLQMGADTDGRVAIMVLDLAARGAVSPETAATLSALVGARMAALEVFDVFTEDDLRQLVDFDALRDTFASCAEDDGCLSSYDQALGVPYLVTGIVDRIDGKTVLSLALLDLQEIKVVARLASTPTEAGAVVPAVHELVDQLLLPLREARTGQLILSVSEEGADLLLNGKIVGSTPVGTAKVAAGPVHVEVAKEGFVRSKRVVTVAPGEQVEVRVVLVPGEEYIGRYKRIAWAMRIGAITAAGLTVASASAGAALWVTNQLLTQQLAQATGQSASPFEPLKVTPAEFFTLWTMRLFAYGLMAAALPAAATAVGLFLIGEPPGRYDQLLEEPE